MVKNWFKQNKGEKHPANQQSIISPSFRRQGPDQEPSRTQGLPGIARNEKSPQDCHSLQQRNSQQPCTSAPTGERPSELCDQKSRLARPPGLENIGNKRGRETLPALQELQKAFERFKMGDHSRSTFSDVIQYVHALQEDNNKISRSREEATAALHGFGDKAKFLISNLHPAGVTEEMGQKGQWTTKGALGFLLEDYNSLWKTNCDNSDKVDTTEAENRHLKRELNRKNILHREEVDQIRGECESRVDHEERRHADERDGIKIHYRNQLEQLGDKHTLEIKQLNLEHGHLTAVLTADHEKALTDLRVRLEEDIRILQEVVTSFADRFRPKSDKDLRFQLDDLKSWVGRVARSPLYVNGEELGERLNRTAFIRLAPERHHKFALESSIWAILMDGIFATPFKIFGDYCAHSSTLWSQLVQENQHSTNPDFDTLQPDTSTEKWRCIKFEPLRRAVTENRTKRPAEEMIWKSYERNVAKILQSLSAVLSRVSSQDRQADIRNIVDKACLLALDCGEQRCRLEFFTPSLQDKVSRQNASAYMDVNGDNKPSLAEGSVLLVVSPGLRRTGDVRGDSLDEVSNLCPAAVYLTETG